MELGSPLNHTNSAFERYLLFYGDGPDVGPAYISPTQIAIGAAVVVVNAYISFSLQLGLHWQLIIGSIRCVVQLTVLGYILVPIFKYDYWWLVVGYSLIMLLVGAIEANGRPAYHYKGMFMQIIACLGAATSIFLSYTLVLVVRTSPWWAAQYFIPILGMLLGNAISGISVGLSTLLDQISSETERLELLLCIGASRWEAIREAVGKSVRVALTPILNQLNVVGIVSIPGMMTGQILSGSDPSQAARYQMIIMFMIAATTAVSSTATILLAAFCLLDSHTQLRTDLMTKHAKQDTLSNRFARAADAGLDKLWRGIKSLLNLDKPAVQSEKQPLLA